MQSDIYNSIALILLLSVVAFISGQKTAQRFSRRTVHIIAGIALLFLLCYAQWLWGSVFLARILAIASLPIIGNWFPVCACFLAGIGWQMMEGKVTRKVFFVVPLILVCFYHAYGFLFRPIPIGGDNWRDGVCLQTSASSCGPASAATLLAHYGISTSEREMIQLCLTRDNGTTLYGLYRGLKRKTEDSEWQVEMFDGSIAELRHRLPAILVVGLEPGAEVDPRYQQQWGWMPGVQHIVVLFSFTDDGRIVVGDPAVGREFWSVEGLDVLWHRRGIRLVSDK